MRARMNAASTLDNLPDSAMVSIFDHVDLRSHARYASTHKAGSDFIESILPIKRCIAIYLNYVVKSDLSFILRVDGRELRARPIRGSSARAIIVDRNNGTVLARFTPRGENLSDGTIDIATIHDHEFWNAFITESVTSQKIAHKRTIVRNKITNFIIDMGSSEDYLIEDTYHGTSIEVMGDEYTININNAENWLGDQVPNGFITIGNENIKCMTFDVGARPMLTLRTPLEHMHDETSAEQFWDAFVRALVCVEP